MKVTPVNHAKAAEEFIKDTSHERFHDKRLWDLRQKRDEQKRNAQKFVVENYHIKPSQDECDAICIGTYIVRSNIVIENDHDWSN